MEMTLELYLSPKRFCERRKAAEETELKPSEEAIPQMGVAATAT